MSLIARAEQIAASPMDAAQELERLETELRELHEEHAEMAQTLGRTAQQLQGAVGRLEALRPLVNACGDGELDSPWNTDALVKLAKGVRATIGGAVGP